MRILVRAIRRLGDLVVAAIVLLLATPLWVLPWHASAAVGRLYGRALGLWWPLGRRVGAINLSRAYGSSLAPADARRILWQSLASLGQSIAEGIQFARRARSRAFEWQALYDAEDPDLEHRLLQDPRPKIFVTGHLGSWEVACALAGRRVEDRGAVIGRRLDNPFLDALVRRLRIRHRHGWIEKRGATTEALLRLRAGDSIALLLDEDAGRRGVFVDFFDRPASTGRIAAVLALNTSSPIVVGACIRRPGRKFLYRLAVIEPPARPDSAAIAVTTQAIVKTLERWIRENPEQWRWIHWRWRTRPDGSRESYARAMTRVDRSRTAKAESISSPRA